MPTLTVIIFAMVLMADWIALESAMEMHTLIAMASAMAQMAN